MSLLSMLMSALAAQHTGQPPALSFFDLHINTLSGKPGQLSSYRGKVVLAVNTASKCGFTPQYDGLEKLYEAYKDRGLVVMGFPSNDFGGQEPGTAETIQNFCEVRFGVKFPMFEKVKTVGDEQHPVYRFLTAKHARPKWNFYKYLVGRDGQVIDVFASTTSPDSSALKEAIEKALGG